MHFSATKNLMTNFCSRLEHCLICYHFDWLAGWVLWHINLCRLFNAKSIFMQIVLFQTIQFSMSTQFNCQNISISSYSVYSNRANSVVSILNKSKNFNLSKIFVLRVFKMVANIFVRLKFLLLTNLMKKNSWKKKKKIILL